MANDIDHRHDLILNAFSPRIAVFTSQEADEACRRNRLPNFACLLRPFQNIPKGLSIAAVTSRVEFN